MGVRYQSIKCASVSDRLSADLSSHPTLAQQCENLSALTVTETKTDRVRKKTSKPSYCSTFSMLTE